MLIGEVLARWVLVDDLKRINKQKYETAFPEKREVRFTQGARGIFNFALHPYVGFTGEPSAQVNMHGFEGPDLLQFKGKDDFNVVITGGSVAGNFYKKLPHWSWKVIQKDLQKFPAIKNKKVNVFSLAIGGWHQPQQLLALNYFLSLGAKIDMVINLDGYNEVVMPLESNLASGVSLFYPIFWKSLTTETYDRKHLMEIGNKVFWEDLEMGLAKILEGPVLNDSALVGFLWERTHQFTRNEIGRTDQKIAALSSQNKTKYFQTGYQFEMDEDQALPLLARNWFESSKIIHQLSKTYGFLYLHVLQPHQYVKGSKPLTKNELKVAYTPDRHAAIMAQKGYQLLLNYVDSFSKQNIKFIDATQVFKDVEEDLYVDICCHFNAKGSQILWERVLGFIKKNHLLN